jgi:flagellar biosynthesis/type III secretory pathway ATPase
LDLGIALLPTTGRRRISSTSAPYVGGSNPKIDHAKANIDSVNTFLRQEMLEKAPYEETVSALKGLFQTEL